MPEKLYIIDGHSQIYRAYYAPFRDLTSPTGEPTRATYVFCSMMLKFIESRRPGHIAMAVDGPAEKLLRRKLYADYKITRKPMPEDLPVQVDRIYQIVQAMGIPVLRAEGYEADDIIATAVERFASPEVQIVLVSRDKDLDQLVGDNVVLYDPMADQTITAESIEQSKGYPPSKAVEAQTLMGDSIDNIPGVPGVGPKKAADLIARYGTVEGVLEHADELTPKLKENLLASAGNFQLARKLATLDRHVPVDLSMSAMRFSGVRVEAVRPIFTELGFSRLLEQLGSMAVVEAPKTAEPTAAKGIWTTAEDFEYSCVDTPQALDELVGDIQAANVKRLSVDTETTSTRPMWAQLVGVSLAWRPGKAVYLPVKGPLGATTLSIELVRRKLGGILSSKSVEKVGQNLKYDLIVLANAGFELAGEFFDTMIAAYVLDSTRASFKLGALAADYLGHKCIPIEDLIGRGRNQTTMDCVPTEAVARYSAEDADVALRLAQVLEKQLAEQGLTDLFVGLEMPLMPVLAEMERRGITINPEALKDMQIELAKQSDVLRDRIVKLVGEPFNVDSPKQLAEVLFSKLKLPVLKRTRSGASTDSSVLEELAVEHELPAMVLEYRKLAKLLSTYLTALGECIHPQTGRVHTSFHQAATVTGRLSSSDPNLQNIPIRTEQGRQIRSAFVADKGCMLISADYSQIELRVLAHLCQDTTLVRAFKEEQDIHRTVAAEVFGVPAAEVTPEQRARAKTVNFGIIYGQTAYGLAQTLRISRTEAQEFIHRYRRRFPEIDEFLQICIAQAKSQGYVETILGRRRRIHEIDSRNPSRRAAAERLAINSVVQGSAADLIKRAMVNIAARIRRQGRPAHMLLQIHDELLFEVPTSAVQSEQEMIAEEMSRAAQLRVPLKVDIGTGRNWMEAK